MILLETWYPSYSGIEVPHGQHCEPIPSELYGLQGDEVEQVLVPLYVSVILVGLTRYVYVKKSYFFRTSKQ